LTNSLDERRQEYEETTACVKDKHDELERKHGSPARQQVKPQQLSDALKAVQDEAKTGGGVAAGGEEQSSSNLKMVSSFIIAPSAKPVSVVSREASMIVDYDVTMKKLERSLRAVTEEEKALVEQIAAEEAEMNRLTKDRAVLEEEEAKFRERECDHWRENSEFTSSCRERVEELQRLEKEYDSVLANEKRFARSKEAIASDIAAICTTSVSMTTTSLVDTYIPLITFPRAASDALDLTTSEAMEAARLPTVRGYRLGVAAGVTIDELNEAFGHASFVLYTLANRLGYHFKQFQLRPFGSRSTVQIRGRSEVYPLHTISELRFMGQPRPSETRPRAGSISKGQSVEVQQQLDKHASLFEKGLTFLLGCMEELRRHCVELWPEVRIHITIKDDLIRWKEEPFCSVRPSASRRENWNHAMLVFLTGLNRVVLQMKQLNAGLQKANLSRSSMDASKRT